MKNLVQTSKSTILDKRRGKSFHSEDGWHSRGDLPHYDKCQLIQFVTFRLNDSLPQDTLKRIEMELLLLPNEKRLSEKARQLEDLIDAGLGNCDLAREDVATIVEQAIFKFHTIRYRIDAWVIMPNHVHLLLKVLPGFTLAMILKSLKSYAARQANRILGRAGSFWFPEYYDRYIRDAMHYEAAVFYIENNPVKAGLSASPEDWRYSSRRSPAGRQPSGFTQL